MSIISSPFRPLQQFYRSGPMPCPYIAGKVERKLFTRLTGPQASDVNSQLSRAGFRRSHDIVYRPVCPGCNACVPVRIPVARFEPDRTMRRILKRNADLTMAGMPASATLEHYHVFAAYQATRHSDSDMSRMSHLDFVAMVEEGRVNTHLFELRDAARTFHGAVLADRLEDGYSAVYSFYDTTEPKRSLGTHLILKLVEECRREGLPYVYLGYWIDRSRKMAYKTRFQPLEALGPDGWAPMAPSATEGVDAGDAVDRDADAAD